MFLSKATTKLKASIKRTNVDSVMKRSKFMPFCPFWCNSLICR